MGAISDEIFEGIGRNTNSTNSSRFAEVDPLSSVQNFLEELATGRSLNSAISMQDDAARDHGGMHENHGQLATHQDHVVGNYEHIHGEVHQHDGAIHSMKMWFHFGCNETVLFHFWQIDSLAGLLSSCLLIFVMACLYEGVKWFRIYLQLSSDRRPPSCSKANSNVKLTEVNCTDCKSSSVPLTNGSCTRMGSKPMWSAVRLFQAVLYLVQLVLAYWLMLIAMTYNVWLTTAVVTGAAFGHWLFAALKYFNPQTDQLDTFATDACH